MSVNAEFPLGQGGRLEVGTVTSSNPAAIAAGAEGSATLTVSGLSTSDKILAINANAIETGLVAMGATITGADTITVQILNTSASEVDGAASAYNYIALIQV